MPFVGLRAFSATARQTLTPRRSPTALPRTLVIEKPGFSTSEPGFFFWTNYEWMIVVGWNPGRAIPILCEEGARALQHTNAAGPGPTPCWAGASSWNIES